MHRNIAVCAVTVSDLAVFDEGVSAIFTVSSDDGRTIVLRRGTTITNLAGKDVLG
jgi:hypothetical protein